METAFKDMEASPTVREQAVDLPGLKVNKPENRSLDDINDNFGNHCITIPGLSATLKASSVDLIYLKDSRLEVYVDIVESQTL